MAQMSENGLNSKMFAAIHKERIDKVCTDSIAKAFVTVNEERRSYFGR